MIPDFIIVESWGKDGNIDIVFRDNMPSSAIIELSDKINYLINTKNTNSCIFDLDNIIRNILENWIYNYKLRYSPIVKEWIFSY